MIPATKTHPEPVCLTALKSSNGDYGHEDVLQQLQADFYNKCYLCEYRNSPASM